MSGRQRTEARRTSVLAMIILVSPFLGCGSPGSDGVFGTGEGFERPRFIIDAPTCPQDPLFGFPDCTIHPESRVRLEADAVWNCNFSHRCTNAVLFGCSAAAWRSSDPAIATVSSEGWMTGVSPGRVTIHATGDCGRFGRMTTEREFEIQAPG